MYVYMCTTQTKTYESTLDCTHNSKRVHVSTVAHAHKPETHPYTNAKHIHAHNRNGTFVIPILTIEAERKKIHTGFRTVGMVTTCALMIFLLRSVCGSVQFGSLCLFMQTVSLIYYAFISPLIARLSEPAVIQQLFGLHSSSCSNGIEQVFTQTENIHIETWCI